MSESTPKCFVVMPFGTKPKNDGSGETYDFDKVYRVVIQRAIREAGMEPIRADETKGARIIHADMFKDLRDQPVVLADLSLFNPNVFYELGIRHVMSATGTVLMCCAGSTLPFDVNLSRVIFYDYDGACLDWDKAEKVVGQLQQSLIEARAGEEPDSPVHALLERVLSSEGSAMTISSDQTSGDGDSTETLDGYQRLLAETWAAQSEKLSDLIPRHSDSAFGARALGHLALMKKRPPAQAAKIARILYDHEQYDLANRMYGQIDEGKLTLDSLLIYGSSISEERLTLDHAKRGLTYLERALDKALPGLESRGDPKARTDVARCYHEIAGMQLWIWQLTREDAELGAAIEAHQRVEEFVAEQLVGQPSADTSSFSLKGAASNLLQLILLHRLQDGDRERPDAEGYRGKLLDLEATGANHPRDASYLHWYQAIALADGGAEEGARDKTFATLAEDGRIRNRPGCSDVGRRQYSTLRRFIEQHSSVWNHSHLVGRVSQALQAGQRV